LQIFVSLGYDWSQGLDYGKLIGSYITTGFQATTFGLAVNEVNKMVS
jgi:deoxyhypusine synthase